MLLCMLLLLWWWFWWWSGVIGVFGWCDIVGGVVRLFLKMGRAFLDRGDGGSFSASSDIDDVLLVFVLVVWDLCVWCKRLLMYLLCDLDVDVGGEFMMFELFAFGDDLKFSGFVGEIFVFLNKDIKLCFFCIGVIVCMVFWCVLFMFVVMGDIGVKWNEFLN